MAVAKMKLVSIIGHMNSLDAVVRVCGSSGVFQPDDALSFFSDTSGFAAIKEDNPYADPLSRLEAAVGRAGGTLSLTDLPETLSDLELADYVQDFASHVSALSRQRADLAARQESLAKDLEQFEHFKGLDIELEDILSCKTIKVRFGRLPKESFDKLKSYNDNPYVLFFPGVTDAEYYWGVYFAPMEEASEVDRIFSSLYFERLRIPSAIGTPDEIVENLKKELAQAEQDAAVVQKQIADYWQSEAPRCTQVYSQLKELDYYFSVRRYAARYNDKFILAGWLPAREAKAMRAALDRVDGIEYSFEQPNSDTHHVPPVKLRNCRLFRPFEFFVDMYGLPRYNEIDPTAFVAITYTILFGVMFGDLGQGICVAVIGWLMWKYKKMAVGRILIPCGISSAVFGLVFGSVFGFEHVLDPLYHALFGLEEKPIEVMNPSMTVNIILGAVLIGLLLIMVAMALNIYSSLRRRDYESGVFGANGIAGLVFYASLVAGLGGQFIGLHLLSVSYVLLLIVLPLLLIFLREPLGRLMARDPDWKPEKWGEYILQNFFELFEIMLSYLSNTMSFLRVGAFVLVHAGMMMAVFAIAGMFHTFGYIVAVIVGNALVMVMEALLVAIQVMRLEFYEMFSRYYNGDGRSFKPLSLSADTKSGK